MEIPRNQRSKDLSAGPAFLAPGRFEPKARARLGGPALRAFAGIAEAWKLSDSQRLSILGFPGRSTYLFWLTKARIQ